MTPEELDNQKQILEATRDTYLTFLRVLTPVFLVTMAGLGSVVMDESIEQAKAKFIIGLLGIASTIEAVLLVNILFRIFIVLKERRKL